MKKCPFCAEDIQDEAIKCKYCRSDLNKNKKISGETLFILFVFGPIIVGLGIWYYLVNTYYFEIDECKKLLANKMKDPESVEFISYELSNNNIELIVSGEYKAKNSFGAYDRGFFFCDKVGEKNMVIHISDIPIKSLDEAIDNSMDITNELLNKLAK